jgi:TonB family protein
MTVNGYNFKRRDYATDTLLLEAIRSRIHRRIYTPQPGQIQEAKIYDFPDSVAHYPGGITEMQKWLKENLVYPETSLELEEQGRVFVTFVIETSSLISNMKVAKSLSRDLDREAKRLIRSMPKWIQGCMRRGPFALVFIYLLYLFWNDEGPIKTGRLFCQVVLKLGQNSPIF